MCSTVGELLEAVRCGRGSIVQAPLDEPIFILRGRDMLAPRIVVQWAFMAEQSGHTKTEVQGALALAKQMADWQASKIQNA